jgi:AraC-like DNA-binding protein
VLTSTVLVAADGITVSDVRCRAERSGWSDVEMVTRFGVVLTRTGAFRRHVDGVESVVDAAAGYVQRPGSEQRIAHPGPGDRCTSLVPSQRMAESILDGATPPAGRGDRALLIDPRLDLAHRGLVALAWRGADADELAERAIVIAGTVLSDLAPRAVEGGFRVASGPRRALADEVRQALDVDSRLPLGDLAGIAGASPYHVSRTFRQVCGLTISRYRARLRVRRALERLAEGERDLAGLAVAVGFADQAHLTRAVRAETGSTPGRLRALLGPPAAGWHGPAEDGVDRADTPTTTADTPELRR